MSICIYIYIQRERERDACIYVYICALSVKIYIFKRLTPVRLPLLRYRVRMKGGGLLVEADACIRFTMLPHGSCVWLRRRTSHTHPHTCKSSACWHSRIRCSVAAIYYSIRVVSDRAVTSWRSLPTMVSLTGRFWIIYCRSHFVEGCRNCLRVPSFNSAPFLIRVNIRLKAGFSMFYDTSTCRNWAHGMWMTFSIAYVSTTIKFHASTRIIVHANRSMNVHLDRPMDRAHQRAIKRL